MTENTRAGQPLAPQASVAESRAQISAFEVEAQRSRAERDALEVRSFPSRYN